jgi:Fur family zinc uptake transcriptional regulator
MERAGRKPRDGERAGLFKRPGHDHERCVADAVAAAETLCAQRGARLTPLRRRVLELVWQGHGPVGAYAVLETLRHERSGAAPPTVYRAIDFLLAHGLIHRIASLNAFVGCEHPAERHPGQFMICRTCGEAAEIDDAGVARAIAASAQGAGFAMDDATLEVRGFCPRCAGQATA